MTRILFVRHGKAADHWADYDRLSEHGVRQARLLATRLLEEEKETTIAAVFHGTLNRQRDTAETVVSEFARRGRALPPATLLPGLDEMDPSLVDAAVHAEPDPAKRERLMAWIVGKGDGGLEARHFLVDTFLRFARGELVGEFESFAAFRARVLASIAQMARHPRQTVLAFTSGGVIATITGEALGAAVEPTVRLMSILENTSITELRYSTRRSALSLARFNDAAHIPVTERTLL